MDFKDYPALYQESSKCADSNQKKHFQLLRIRVALLIGYAILGAVTWSKITDLSFVPLISITIALSMGLIFTIIIEMRKFDRLWFSSRIIAEAAKKETWLFMMRSKPYDQIKPEEETETDFIDSLREIVNSHPSVVAELCQYHEVSIQVTNRMRETRTTGVPERIKFFAEDRLQDQQRWYAKKAKFNLQRASYYTILMWIFQALTVVFALINVLIATLPFNLVGIATTTAAAVLLWSNTRGYNELSQSYGYIAQDLSFYEDKTRYIDTETQLLQFVTDVENTMNRERAVWNTRRRPSIKPTN